MLEATTEKRGSSEVVKVYRKIMNTVRNSEIMQKQRDNYHDRQGVEKQSVII